MSEKSGIPTVPILLVPEPVERVWGGDAVGHVFGWKPPEGKRIGEWWILSFRRDHASTIKDGEFEGIPLPQLVQAHPELLGEGGEASLLIKIIDSAERLSVQVHPDDALARKMGLDSGKTECWYFLESSPDAVIFCGLEKGVEPEAFFDRAAQDPAPGEMEGLLHAVPVRDGDAVFIDAGTIHAIGEGALLMEVQQNSDTTFRIYDWGRPRTVHLAEARRAVMEARPERTAGEKESGLVAACDKFTMEKLHLEGPHTLDTPADRVWAGLTCLKGRGMLSCTGYSSAFNRGDTFFIPARCPPMTIEPRKHALFMHSKPATAGRITNGS